MRFVLFSLLFVLVASVTDAAACSCADSRTVQDEFTRSPIVVTARLDALEEVDRTVEGKNVYRTMAAVMSVEKVYKGNLRSSQLMRIMDGAGGDCTTAFQREKIGQRYLFFTDPPTKIGNLKGPMYLISQCSRSTKIETAGPDLAYLDNRTELAGKTRLSGTVRKFTRDSSNLGNIKVTVSGRNFERTVETDERGFFELWALPAGKYKVAFQVPHGTKIGAFKYIPADRTWRREYPPNNTLQATIGPRKHFEITVALDIDTASGQ